MLRTYKYMLTRLIACFCKDSCEVFCSSGSPTALILSGVELSLIPALGGIEVWELGGTIFALGFPSHTTSLCVSCFEISIGWCFLLMGFSERGDTRTEGTGILLSVF